MTTDSDAAIYAEVNDVTHEEFTMDINKCYSDVKPTLNKENVGKRSSSKKQEICFFTISVIVVVMMMVLVATCICVSIALIQIGALQQRANTNFELWGNISQQLRTELDHNTILLINANAKLHSEVQQLRAKLDHNTMEIQQNFSQLHSDVQQLRVEYESSYFTSCANLPPFSPSDYYFLRASNGSVVVVYCDMTLSCDGVTGGWMRVAELNMTDTSQQCPSNFVERNEAGIRQCRIPGNGCFSVYYSAADVSYSRVCGRITAYQVGTTNAFRGASDPSTTIDSTYVDGVSLTHGTRPRQHIWTFAAGLDRTGDFPVQDSYCPCQDTTLASTAPSFVGEDYFCDAGNENFVTGETNLQTDPLWDGTDCLCCDNPPWFYKQLPQPTTDNIEMRVCKDEHGGENIGLKEAEIYVQ